MRITDRQRDRAVGAFLLSPLGILIFALVLFPVAWVLFISLRSTGLYQTESVFVGMENFRAVIGAEGFRRGVSNTTVFAVGSILLQMPIGLAIAYLLNEKFPLRNGARGLILFSYLVPYVVAALTFRFMLSEATGILNYYASAIPGLPGNPLGDPDWAMPAVIFINTWKNFPFMVLVFLAQFQSIPHDLYESARIDGALRRHIFRHIELPLILPVMLVIGMLRTIWNFNNFEVVFLLTQGGPLGRTETLPLLIYRIVFGDFSLGRGAALAVIVLLILTAMSFVYWRLYEWSTGRVS